MSDFQIIVTKTPCISLLLDLVTLCRIVFVLLETSKPKTLVDTLECCRCITSIVSSHLPSSLPSCYAFSPSSHNPPHTPVRTGEKDAQLVEHFVSWLLPRCSALLVGAACDGSDSPAGENWLRRAEVVAELCKAVRLVIQAALPASV